MDPGHSLSLKTAGSLFLFGLGLSFAGKGAFDALLKKSGLIPKKGPVRFAIENFKTQGAGQIENEMNLAQSYDGLSSVYMLALRDTSQRRGLMTYLGTLMMGYVSGSVAQGTQETWVRRQETRIRADLINRMKGVFRQSIQNKTEFDNRLKEEAKARIFELLERHRIPDAQSLLQERPPVESAAQNQRYFYEPTHRSLAASDLKPDLRLSGSPASGNNLNPNDMQAALANPLAPRFGMDTFGNRPSAPSSQQKKPFWLLKTGIAGAGVLTGLALQSFLRLFTGHVENHAFPGKIINYETIRLEAQEALTIHGIASRQNFFVMAGFFAIAAAAKVGKLVVDGMREIEVTRRNAQTELAYQTHNWLSQDPAFHEIAETEALHNSLRELEQDLPLLRDNRSLLQQRIQTVLANVGRNSAPKYFQMTPPVGLVVSRA